MNEGLIIMGIWLDCQQYGKKIVKKKKKNKKKKMEHNHLVQCSEC